MLENVNALPRTVRTIVEKYFGVTKRNNYLVMEWYARDRNSSIVVFLRMAAVWNFLSIVRAEKALPPYAVK